MHCHRMTKLRITLLATALVVASKFLSGQAHAAMVQIIIDNGNSGTGFSYSDLHDGNSAPLNFGGVNYFASGATLATPFSGTLTGDLTVSAGITTLTGIVGVLSSASSLAPDGVTFNFAGGWQTDTDVVNAASTIRLDGILYPAILTGT